MAENVLKLLKGTAHTNQQKLECATEVLQTSVYLPGKHQLLADWIVPLLFKSAQRVSKGLSQQQDPSIDPSYWQFLVDLLKSAKQVVFKSPMVPLLSTILLQSPNESVLYNVIQVLEILKQEYPEQLRQNFDHNVLLVTAILNILAERPNEKSLLPLLLYFVQYIHGFSNGKKKLASFLAHWMEPALKARNQHSIELDSILEKLFHTCAFNAEHWPLICKSSNENHPFYTVLNQYPQYFAWIFELAIRCGRKYLRGNEKTMEFAFFDYLCQYLIEYELNMEYLVDCLIIMNRFEVCQGDDEAQRPCFSRIHDHVMSMAANHASLCLKAWKELVIVDMTALESDTGHIIEWIVKYPADSSSKECLATMIDVFTRLRQLDSFLTLLLPLTEQYRLTMEHMIHMFASLKVSLSQCTYQQLEGLLDLTLTFLKTTVDNLEHRSKKLKGSVEGSSFEPTIALKCYLLCVEVFPQRSDKQRLRLGKWCQDCYDQVLVYYLDTQSMSAIDQTLLGFANASFIFFSSRFKEWCERSNTLIPSQVNNRLFYLEKVVYFHPGLSQIKHDVCHQYADAWINGKVPDKSFCASFAQFFRIMSDRLNLETLNKVITLLLMSLLDDTLVHRRKCLGKMMRNALFFESKNIREVFSKSVSLVISNNLNQMFEMERLSPDIFRQYLNHTLTQEQIHSLTKLEPLLSVLSICPPHYFLQKDGESLSFILSVLENWSLQLPASEQLLRLIQSIHLKVCKSILELPGHLTNRLNLTLELDYLMGETNMNASKRLEWILERILYQVQTLSTNTESFDTIKKIDFVPGYARILLKTIFQLKGYEKLSLFQTLVQQIKMTALQALNKVDALECELVEWLNVLYLFNQQGQLTVEEVVKIAQITKKTGIESPQLVSRIMSIALACFQQYSVEMDSLTTIRILDQLWRLEDWSKSSLPQHLADFLRSTSELNYSLFFEKLKEFVIHQSGSNAEKIIFLEQFLNVKNVGRRYMKRHLSSFLIFVVELCEQGPFQIPVFSKVLGLYQNILGDSFLTVQSGQMSQILSHIIQLLSLNSVLSMDRSVFNKSNLENQFHQVCNLLVTCIMFRRDECLQSITSVVSILRGLLHGFRLSVLGRHFELNQDLVVELSAEKLYQLAKDVPAPLFGTFAPMSSACGLSFARVLQSVQQRSGNIKSKGHSLTVSSRPFAKHLSLLLGEFVAIQQSKRPLVSQPEIQQSVLDAMYAILDICGEHERDYILRSVGFINTKHYVGHYGHYSRDAARMYFKSLVGDWNKYHRFTGYVESTQDALIVFQACHDGVFHRIRRRLVDRERRYIRSGSVFVYDEHESGIKRWTDGRLWSPSRILGNFLIYRELEKKITKNQRKNSKDPLLQLYLDDRRAHSGSKGTYIFKEDGLIKKTMSVYVNGHSQHLVCYYSKEDVQMERLPIIRYMPQCQHVQISSNLVIHQNFIEKKTGKSIMPDFSNLFNDDELDQLIHDSVHQPVRKRQRTLTAPASFYSSEDMMYDMTLFPTLESTKVFQEMNESELLKQVNASELLKQVNESELIHQVNASELLKHVDMLDSQTLASLLPPQISSPLMDLNSVSSTLTFDSHDSSLSTGDHLFIEPLEKQNDPLSFLMTDYFIRETMMDHE